MTTKSNAEWDQLCDLTTQLFPRYGARELAFKEACRQRPDLAAAAIDPAGNPVTVRQKRISRWNTTGAAAHLREVVAADPDDSSASVLMAVVEERAKR